MKNALSTLFSRKMRLPRRSYWLGVLLAVAPFFVFVLISNYLGRAVMVRLPACMICMLAVAWLGGRRLTDVSFSPWWGWLLLLFAAFIGTAPTAFLLLVSPLEDYYRTLLMITPIGFLLFFVQVVVIGLLPGTRAPNKYGPSPNERGVLDKASILFD